MKKAMSFVVALMLGSVAFADGGRVLHCGSDTPFHGIVEQIASGNCQGQWAIDLGGKRIVPLPLPGEYKRAGARVMGCFDYSDVRPFCEVSGSLLPYAHIKRIFPDNP